MMGLGETLVFYAVIGAAVAVAVWATEAGGSRQRLFRTGTAVLFWPIYLPLLLTPQPPARISAAADPPQFDDELSRQVAAVECELDAAFTGLEGWAEATMLHERSRIAELRVAWGAQAVRIRQMDELLAENRFVSGGSRSADKPLPICRAEQARQDNFEKLSQIREQAHEELSTSLARVRELVSLIHLAKFTGEPAARAEQLVAEIAASVEGLSEVAAWSEPVAAR